jgi:hypothetical protein
LADMTLRADAAEALSQTPSSLFMHVTAFLNCIGDHSQQYTSISWRMILDSMTSAETSDLGTLAGVSSHSKAG